MCSYPSKKYNYFAIFVSFVMKGKAQVYLDMAFPNVRMSLHPFYTVFPMVFVIPLQSQHNIRESLFYLFLIAFQQPVEVIPKLLGTSEFHTLLISKGAQKFLHRIEFFIFPQFNILIHFALARLPFFCPKPFLIG